GGKSIGRKQKPPGIPGGCLCFLKRLCVYQGALFGNGRCLFRHAAFQMEPDSFQHVLPRLCLGSAGRDTAGQGWSVSREIALRFLDDDLVSAHSLTPSSSSSRPASKYCSTFPVPSRH